MKAAWAILGVVCLVGGAVGCESDDAGAGNGNEDGQGMGGGPSPGGGIEPVSGSRLEVRSWKGDGIRSFDSIFDTELDISCTFRSAADGEHRCVPVIPPGTDSASVLFSDADCTKAVAYVSYAPCNEVAPYVLDESRSDECAGKGGTLYRVASKIATPEAVYTVLADGSCTETTTGGDEQFYAVEKVAPSSLVSAKVEVVERSEALGVEMFAGSDGSRVPRGLRDLKLGSACSPNQVGPIGQESTYCLGRIAFFLGDYSDAECAEPVAAGSGACGDPDIILSYEMVAGTDSENGCFETSLHEVGEEASRSSIYKGWTEGCQKDDAPYYDHYFLLGQPAEASDLVVLERTHAGEGRLVLQQYSEGGTNIAPDGGLWDQELDAACTPFSMGDKSYCVPGLDYIHDSTLFGDADCTQPVVTQFRSPCRSTQPEVHYIVRTLPGDASCTSPGIDGLYVAEKLDGDSYYVSGDGGCVETPVDSTFDYYVVGAEVAPADTFAELTYETDD